MMSYHSALEGNFLKTRLIRGGRKVIKHQPEMEGRLREVHRRQGQGSVFRAKGCSNCGSPSVPSQDWEQQ